MDAKDYDVGMIMTLLFVSFLLLCIVIVSIPQDQGLDRRTVIRERAIAPELVLPQHSEDAVVKPASEGNAKRRLPESGDPV
jgi:hypothetical protein